MGVSFDPDMRIALYKPAVFKEALHGFMRTRSPGNVIDLKSVFHSAATEPLYSKNASTEASSIQTGRAGSQKRAKPSLVRKLNAEHHWRKRRTCHKLGSDFWIPKRLSAGGLDGRNAITLVNATRISGTSIVLRRRIELSPKSWTLRVWFDSLETYHSRKRVDRSTLPDMAATAALIIAVDAERMLRRAAEDMTLPEVQVRLDQGDLSEDIRAYFVKATCNHLMTRTIKIEPQGWSGMTVSIVCD